MNSKRVYYLLMASIGILAVLSVGAVYFGNKLLVKESSTLVAKKLENRVLDEQQNALSLVSKQSEKYAQLESIAKSVVPQDKNQAKAVREIVALADQSGISLQSITFPTSSLGASSSGSSSSSGSNSSSGSTTKPTVTETQVKPVSGINGVYQLDITVQSSPSKPVSFAQLTDFLSKLEKNRRTAQVTGLTITPSGTSGKLSFSLIISVYLKP